MVIESNYDILGIPEGSTEKEIRDAFRQLALQSHSDRGGESNQFIRIKQAYEDLKIGKKYPDTEDERLKNSRVFANDMDVDVMRRNQILGQQIYKEMKSAEEWAAALCRANITATRLFGSKTLGEIELERKANGALLIKGNFMAGSITYDGPIMMRGNITSPSMADEYRTDIRLERGDFKMVDPLENKYKIENGAYLTVENGNAIIGDVYGRKYRVEDTEGRVGVYKIRERRTQISAPNGKIVVENVENTVTLNADTVIIFNAQDDIVISTRELLFYGNKITYDCTIKLKKGGTMRFFEEFSIQGLSGDAKIELEDSKVIRLFNLKTRRIRNLPDDLIPDKEQYAKDATMVGKGFTITYEMLQRLPVGEMQKKSESTKKEKYNESTHNNNNKNDSKGWASKFKFRR